jgi:predicted permease
LAWWGTHWLARIEIPPQLPPVLFRLAPDAGVLAFAVAVTGFTGVLFGLIPALGTSRPDLVSALKTGSAGSVGGDGGRIRVMFVAGQVALAVTLLLTATLFARSLQAGLRAELGFEPDGVVAASVSLGAPLDYDEQRGRQFYRALLERVRALPGVERASIARHVLASGSSSGGNVRRPDAPDVPEVNASYTLVSPEYFETMRIELLAGRGFTTVDAQGAPRVAVINSTLADRLWPGESPLGQRIEGFGDGPAEVIGVTRDSRYAMITEEPRPFVFLSFAQAYHSGLAIHARAPGAEAATLRAIADEVRALDPDIAIGLSGPVDHLIGFNLFPQRFAAQVVGAFGIVGLILAALGIHGVLTFQVARRTRELGVRRALGASSGRVIRSVVLGGGALAAAGCALGTAAGAAIAHALRSSLFGIRPLDPVTFTTVPLALLGVAVLASGIPALRASAVEASEALKND